MGGVALRCDDEEHKPMSPADLVLFAIKMMANLVTDTVVVIDADNVIIEANPAANDLLGRSRPELVGESVKSLVAGARSHAELAAALAEPPRELVDEPPLLELELAHAAGGLVGVAARAARIGSFTILAMSPIAQQDADSAAGRLAALETGVRNISWELQALGFDVRLAQRPSAAISADGLRNLSKREREVLDAFLGGMSVSASATHLHVSEHTVRSHLKAIYRKLGVRSQTELMLRMRENPPWE
jgi:DNA-binding CsgD family transcriptional regulator